ncbi:unnamed protein product [Lathyrus oleraceus]
MVHGGLNKRRVRVNPASRRSTTKKFKPPVSLKNQIRSAERMLRKNLPLEVKAAQEQKLESLKKQQEVHTRLALERKLFLRDKKIKFFERRKIERRIRRLEKLQRASSSSSPDQLASLKHDLQYVMYFPKNEKYVPLFCGSDDQEIVDKRNGLRKQIEERLSAAAASGKDLEETGSEDDGLLDLSDDDFFLAGSSSDEADADDELTDKSTREQASSASGKAVSGMSSDEKNQRQISARTLMPPPRPSNKMSRFGSSSGQNSSKQRSEFSKFNNTSNNKSSSDFRVRGRSGTSHGSSISSNSDAHKPRRKRRPKKKKQA